MVLCYRMFQYVAGFAQTKFHIHATIFNGTACSLIYHLLQRALLIRYNNLSQEYE